jgi:hypothetical protein
MLKKSSPLKLFGQMEPNLAGSIYVRSSIKQIWKVNGRTTDAKWWQYLTWPFGSGELKKIISENCFSRTFHSFSSRRS